MTDKVSWDIFYYETEDVEKILVERFPGKRFACHESILKEVGFLS